MTYDILKLFSIFTVLSVVGYSLCPKKYRHMVLLVLSLLGVWYYSRWGLMYLIITILTTFMAGLMLNTIDDKHSTKGLEKAERKAIRALAKKRKKWVVFGYLVINIGILFGLKYSTMFMAADTIPGFFKIALPLGISYYTLQSVSYVVDVFRGKYKAETNLFRVALFVGFLPQLHEGPFGRYDVYKTDMFKNEPIKKENVFNGLATIIWGLFKIFMIANRAAMVADNVFQNYKEYNGPTILVGGIFFTLQLYAEFSGYINVASGISEIFGIHLVKNFDMPFIAKDVAEFWRRWHISLGEWFRDYVFYPVSTSKIFKKAPDFIVINSALLAVWFLTGLWHGASWKYVVYGLYYFILMVGLNVSKPIMSNIYRKLKIQEDSLALNILRIVVTQFLVVVGMIMFRAENVTVFFDMISNLFATGASLDILKVMDIKEAIVLILSVAVLIGVPIMNTKGRSIRNSYNKMSSVQKYLVCFGATCLVIIFGAYGLDYIPPDPIYGGF